MVELVCSICLHVNLDKTTLDEDSRADLDVLTVMNGQMVCVYHSSYAQGGEHRRMIARAQS